MYIAVRCMIGCSAAVLRLTELAITGGQVAMLSISEDHDVAATKVVLYWLESCLEIAEVTT